MYARITTIKGDPSRLAELPAKIKEMIPAAKALPGIIDIYASWRADGQGFVTSIYDSKASADAAAAHTMAMWSELSSLLVSAPVSEGYDHVDHMVG